VFARETGWPHKPQGIISGGYRYRRCLENKCSGGRTENALELDMHPVRRVEGVGVALAICIRPRNRFKSDDDDDASGALSPRPPDSPDPRRSPSPGPGLLGRFLWSRRRTNARVIYRHSRMPREIHTRCMGLCSSNSIRSVHGKKPLGIYKIFGIQLKFSKTSV